MFERLSHYSRFKSWSLWGTFLVLLGDVWSILVCSNKTSYPFPLKETRQTLDEIPLGIAIQGDDENKNTHLLYLIAQKSFAHLSCSHQIHRFRMQGDLILLCA